ncbi:hypothetical protein BO78DRAFT_396223, partial [Aspergillus sclerotiicarbonarius CBS 121057]
MRDITYPVTPLHPNPPILSLGDSNPVSTLVLMLGLCYTLEIGNFIYVPPHRSEQQQQQSG